MALSLPNYAQVIPHPMPCDSSLQILRNDKGEPMWLTSDQMKKRAMHKEDVSPLLKQADIKGAAVVDLLVDPSGKVACIKSLVGHPIIRAEVERALKNWTFRPTDRDGKAIAYLGEITFSFCNISCGDVGPSMTVLK